MTTIPNASRMEVDTLSEEAIDFMTSVLGYPSAADAPDNFGDSIGDHLQGNLMVAMHRSSSFRSLVRGMIHEYKPEPTEDGFVVDDPGLVDKAIFVLDEARNMLRDQNKDVAFHASVHNKCTIFARPHTMYESPCLVIQHTRSPDPLAVNRPSLLIGVFNGAWGWATATPSATRRWNLLTMGLILDDDHDDFLIEDTDECRDNLQQIIRLIGTLYLVSVSHEAFVDNAHKIDNRIGKPLVSSES